MWGGGHIPPPLGRCIIKRVRESHFDRQALLKYVAVHSRVVFIEYSHIESLSPSSSLFVSFFLTRLSFLLPFQQPPYLPAVGKRRPKEKQIPRPTTSPFYILHNSPQVAVRPFCFLRYITWQAIDNESSSKATSAHNQCDKADSFSLPDSFFLTLIKSSFKPTNLNNHLSPVSHTNMDALKSLVQPLVGGSGGSSVIDGMKLVVLGGTVETARRVSSSAWYVIEKLTPSLN